jgi:Mce-associated membrane protein
MGPRYRWLTVAEVPRGTSGLEASAARAGTGDAPSPESPGFEARKLAPQPPSAGLATLFDSRRATTVLLSLVAVLALVAGGIFTVDAQSDNGTSTARPSRQPVLISGDDATAAVDAAAKAAQTILTRNYKLYDKQIDEATALMTPAYAKEFRDTAESVKDKFVSEQVDQQVRIVAQGITHATRTEVQALLFMNYYVSKAGGDTTYTAYRALVTVLHTDRGWIVSAIDTK